MNARSFNRYAFCVSMIVALAACGGNSGDGTTPVPATVNGAASAGTDNGAKIVLVGTGWHSPQYTAVDLDGSVYVADRDFEVVRVSPPFTGRSHGKIKIIVKDAVVGVAVDNQKNVYYSGSGGYIGEITPKGLKNTVCPSFSDGFEGIAVDSNENVYAAGSKGGSTGGGQLYFIAHKAKGGWKAPTLFGPTFTGLGANGVAVDGRGDAYVSLDNDVKKVEPSGKVVAVGSGFVNPYGVAVPVACRGACSVYVADSGNSAIKKVSPPFTGATHGKITEVGYGFLDPLGVAARNSDAYVADTGNVQVKEVIP